MARLNICIRTRRIIQTRRFIGRSDRDEFTKVAHTEKLSLPGTIFRYASYVQEQEAFLSIYLDCYHTNLKGKVYTESGAYYVLK